MRLTRRQLLISALASLGASVAGWAYAEEYDYKALIISVLHRRLGYLNLDEGSLNQFSTDFIDDYGTLGLQGRLLALGRPALGLIENVQEDEVSRFEDRVVSKYLLSTDFFRNNADEALPVRYVVYYNPYKVACANPFAILGDE